MKQTCCLQVEHHRGEAKPGKDRGKDCLPTVPGDVPGRSAGPEGDHELPADGKLCTGIRDCHRPRGGSGSHVAFTRHYFLGILM